MIKSAHKPIELKAPESVKAPVRSNDLRASKVSPKEKEAFKEELSEAKEALEPKVKPVEVSSDKALRKPSSLIKEEEAQTGTPDTVSPKVFDPSLTEDVQKLIDPTTVQATEVPAEDILAKLTQGKSTPVVAQNTGAPVEAEMAPEVAQALLKTPQVQAEALVQNPGAELGRSPAIDFAKAEVDPALMSMEDFVAQKNAATKKALPQNAYGMKSQNLQKLALENGLKQTQVVKDVTGLEGTTGSGTGASVNSQQFILNTLAEQPVSKNIETGAATVKTFDLSQIKTADADKIMNQISNYIIQAKASKEPTVSMRMTHDELGMIDITVMKSGVMNSEAVAINIGAHSIDGKNFFQQNSKDLFQHLTTAGINVSDLKVETPSNSSRGEFDLSQQNQKQSPSGERQFGSEQNQRRHDQERRQDLWKMFNQEAA